MKRESVREGLPTLPRRLSRSGYRRCDAAKSFFDPHFDLALDGMSFKVSEDLARQNARRALELLPSDTADPEERRKGIKASAERKLKQFGEKPE